VGEPPPDQQLTRAVANTLWWHLQGNVWPAALETRAISPTGAPRSASYNSAGRMPGPQLDGEALTPTVEVISRTPLIRANLWSDDWPGRTAWRILLARPDADRALSRMPAAAIAEYESALEHATCRKPFTIERDENGDAYLTRNRHDGTITHLTAAALEAIARVADLHRIPPHVEDALITDSDISLDAIRAALQLAGGADT